MVLLVLEPRPSAMREDVPLICSRGGGRYIVNPEEYKIVGYIQLLSHIDDLGHDRARFKQI